MPIRAREVFGEAAGVAVFAGQPLHHVVHRHELVGVVMDLPLREMQRIMPGVGLRFGRLRQQHLVADRGDEVEVDLHLILGAPRVALLLHHVIAGRHPVVPEAERHVARGAAGADVHERQCRGRRAEFDRTAA